MKIIKCENNNIDLILKEVTNVDDKIVKFNSTDGAVEKHVPIILREDNKIMVKVNHVMEENHYIEWILVDFGNEQIIKHFKPGETPEIVLDFRPNLKAYAYCNLHGLWVSK